MRSPSAFRARHVILALAGTLLAHSPPVFAQTAELYHVDDSHATLEFGTRLVGFNRVRGTFDTYRGDILFVGDDPLKSAVSIAIDVRSVHTRSTERDAHLASPDFFDAQRWPSIVFTSSRIERDGNAFVAIGPLRIRDVTREIRVPFSMVAQMGEDPFGNTRFAVAGHLVLNRRDFGVMGPAFWNRAISDSIEIEFELPGRRWNYSRLSFGPRGRTSGGQLVFEALSAKPVDAAIADAWRVFTEHRADSTYNFSTFEYQKAAGKLAQSNKTREAKAVLELGIRVADALEVRTGSSNLHTELAELHLKSGDRARALEHARQALQSDETNTAAILLMKYLGAST